ncbi:MAG: hypothetical protein GXP15_04600 [Gammaproteobacteria bacterium]|nr:hypothetical protein [Gammaproteobacteria bacterium]
MYHHAKSFGAAVSALVSHSHIKQRLVEAYEKNLAGIEEGDLPIPVRRAFADLRRKMTAVAPLNGEGPIRASVRKMSMEQADQCAQLMVDLCSAMIRYGEDLQESLPLDTDEQQGVPPFLVKSV